MLSFTHTDKLGISSSNICSYSIEIERRVIPGFSQCSAPSVGEAAVLYCHAKENANVPGGRKGSAVCQRQRLQGKVTLGAHHHHHCLVQRRMRRGKTTAETRSRRRERETEKKREGERGRAFAHNLFKMSLSRFQLNSTKII